MYIDNEGEVVTVTVSSNGSNAHSINIQNEAHSEADTYERNLRFDNYYERGVLFAGYVLTIVTVLTGTFVGTNALLSWVWVIPLMLVIACFIAKRFVFLLVPLVLFIGLVILVFTGTIFTMYAWAFIAGNETLDLPGLKYVIAEFCEVIPLIGGFLGWAIVGIGWFIDLLLVFMVPAWLVYQLVRRIFDHESSLGRTLLLTIGTVLSFIAPIGWAVIMNAGY